MKVKVFKDKRIKIKKVSQGELKKTEKFLDFINSLIEEEAKILWNKKKSLKEEKEWLGGVIKNVQKRKEVFLLAEYDDQIVGTTSISLREGREGHVGDFGIAIRKGYRGIGLGKYLLGEVLKLAKKELKPKPEIIRLSVYPNNKPAITLYKKMGFKEVARIPKQIKFKRKLLSEVIMLLYLK